MAKHYVVYKTDFSAYREDGMWLFFSTRAVYIDLFNKLSSCMFSRCPFYGLTCDKCHYGT